MAHNISFRHLMGFKRCTWRISNDAIKPLRAQPYSTRSQINQLQVCFFHPSTLPTEQESHYYSSTSTRGLPFGFTLEPPRALLRHRSVNYGNRQRRVCKQVVESHRHCSIKHLWDNFSFVLIRNPPITSPQRPTNSEAVSWSMLALCGSKSGGRSNNKNNRCIPTNSLTHT